MSDTPDTPSPTKSSRSAIGVIVQIVGFAE